MIIENKKKLEGMKVKNNITRRKSVFIVAITIIVVLFTGMTARGAAFYDNPILIYYVRENPFTTPQEETFSILQIFEENGFTRERIDNIQFAVLPNDGAIIVTNEAQLQAVWDILSEIKVTTRGAAQAPLNDERAIYVDFQFVDPNYNLGIEMFGHIYILGRGPFIFEEGFCEQPFIDLFMAFSTIHVEPTPPEPIEEGYEIEIIVEPIEEGSEIVEPPTDDIPHDVDPYDYPPTENEDMFNDISFIELLEASGFVVEEGQEFPGGTMGSPLSTTQRVIYVDGEMIRIEIFDSREVMERASSLIGITSVSCPEYPDRPTFQITWHPESAPRWFKRDLIIVFYSDHESHLLDFLMENLEFFQGFDL